MLYNFNSISLHPILKNSKGVYCIHCLNGKDYIGSTIVNFRTRLLRHFNELKNNIHHNQYLQNTFNKYGIDYFTISLIYISENPENILTEEQWYIDNIKPEFNISLKVDYPKCVIPEIIEESVKKQINTKRLKSSKNNKGINVDKRTGKYIATISIKGQKYLGTYDTYQEALDVRKKAETDYWQNGKQFQKISDNKGKLNLTKARSGSGTSIRKTESGRYSAAIRIKYKNISLGTFSTYEEALEVRLQAESVFWNEDFYNKSDHEAELIIKNFVDPIKAKIPLNTKTGYKYINNQGKSFQFYYRKHKFYKKFDTLEEAVNFRDQFIENLKKSGDIN